MFPNEEKKPVKAASLSTPLSEEVATTGSAEVKSAKPSLLISLINLISIFSKILDRVHELLLGDRVYMTYVNSDGTSYSGFVTKDEVKKSEYEVDWKMYGRADVLKQMVDDHLLEEYFPDNRTRGLRVSRAFRTMVYGQYADCFVSDVEFYSLSFIYSSDGQRFNSESWRQFKKRH